MNPVHQISDESSEDEAEKIRALEEDQGIHHYIEEVVLSPREEKEDFPMLRNTKSAINRRQSVRFAGPYNEEEDGRHEHLRSPSPQSLAFAKALEDPMAHQDEDETSNYDDDFDHVLSNATSNQVPMGDPPAYTSGDESQKPPAGPPQPIREKKSRGSLNELLLSKVAQPFQNMMRRTSRIEEDTTSDENDEEDEDFTEEEIQVLTYIDAYKPPEIDIRPQLRPFLLDYIPAIGDIDAFIKIPRPDDVDDNVGLTHLDEPALKQSDATILSMQLRNVSKEVVHSTDEPPVKLLSRADKHAEQIDNWITNIKELHKTKPAQTVHFKNQMPDIDTLMQEWPAKFEELLKKNKLPTADLDVPLEVYADIVLSICDVPVGKSRIQSLHLLFSLLNEFNNSQHFRNLAQNNERAGQTNETTDRLEL